MTKYLLIALAVVALLGGLFGKLEYARAEKAQEALQAAQERTRNAEAALTKAQADAALLRATSLQRQQELNRLRVQAEAQQKALNEALKANPDWAGAPVPAGVLDALTGPRPAASQAGPGVDRSGAGAVPAGK